MYMCNRCRRVFANSSWHAEQCDGQPIAYQPCNARATLPERRCALPYGHTGEHEWRRGL